MGLSGLVGAGAAEGLEDVLARQMMEQQQAEMARARRAQEAMQQQQLGLATRRQDFEEQARQEDIEQDRISDMRAQGDKFDARMTRLQGEEDQMDAMQRLEEELAALSPSARRAFKLGVKPDAAALMSPEERDAEEKRKIEFERQKANATRAPQAPRVVDPQWVLDAGGAQHFRVPQNGDKKYEKPSEPKGGGSDYATERADRTIAAVDALIPQATAWTTGMGSLLKNMPSTDARAFEGKLKTLTGNIAFNELTQMREASKTGGALGAVSERELELLSSTLGAIDSGQDRENVVQQLEQIKASVQRWKDAKALEGTPGNGVTVIPPPSAGAQQKPIPGIPGGVAESTDGGKTWKRVK